MQITWQGLSSLRIQTKETTILVDPFPSSVGLSAPRLIADLFLFSSQSNPQRMAAATAKGFVIDHPGEYEHRGVLVTGIAFHQTVAKLPGTITLYTIEAEGLLLGHLGALAQTLSEKELEELEDVDVLFVPVGGKTVLTAKQALDVISRIEPRIVVPTYFRLGGLKQALDGVEIFRKEMGLKDLSTQDKIRLSKRDLPEEGIQTIILQP